MHLNHLILYSWVVPATVMAQRIFIDELPGYKALPSCAERPIHTIVKDMSKGCGDHQKTTSYSCFCTASSTKFVSLISKEVAKLCLPDTTTAVEQATDLFGSYCAIGTAANGTADSVWIRDDTRDADPVEPECSPNGVAGCGHEPTNLARVAFRNGLVRRRQIPVVQSNLGICLTWFWHGRGVVKVAKSEETGEAGRVGTGRDGSLCTHV
ncbi:hypothetical protein PG991_016199 [Apiospora marii]|uniref:Extracellular membrane protein CFEM domain-containing protein n=1 Tax=Apiospora marii TaxID=335849 RepID=A0ABR1R116_9PEZI